MKDYFLDTKDYFSEVLTRRNLQGNISNYQEWLENLQFEQSNNNIMASLLNSEAASKEGEQKAVKQGIARSNVRSARLDEMSLRMTEEEIRDAKAIANDIVRIMMQAGTSLNMAEFAFEAVLESMRSIKWKDE